MLRVVQDFKTTLLWDYLRHAGMAALALATLGVVVWAGATVWLSHPCREVGVGSFFGQPGCPQLLLDVVPLIVAFGFWVAAVAVGFMGYRGLLVGFFMLGAGVLATGKLSLVSGDVGGRLFYVLLAWLSPLLLQFHRELIGQGPSGRSPGPANRPSSSRDWFSERLVHIAAWTLCGLGVLWSLPFSLFSLVSLQQWGWFTILRSGVLATFLASGILTAIFLAQAYGKSTSLLVRRRIRLIFLSALLASTPLVLFYLLPNILGLFEPLHEVWAFPGLLLIPLIYVYALMHRRLARSEDVLRRAAVYYLLIVLAVGFYVVILGVLSVLVSDMAVRLEHVALLFLLSVAMLFLFAPLRHGIDRLTNWVWYGGQVPYFDLVEQLVDSLSLALDRETLRHLLVEDLASAMNLPKTALLLKDQYDHLTLLGCIGFDLYSVTACQWPGDGSLTTYLQDVAKPMSHDQVQQALEDVTCYPGERAWLSRRDVAFWLPLVSGGVLQGLLLLGLRLEEEDAFTIADRRTLTTLARQSGIAAHNVRLMEQVQAGRQELARAHQQLLVGREQERRRLAHDLHDIVVQQLIGISYQLAEGRRRASVEGSRSTRQAEEMVQKLEVIRREVLDVVAQLRSMIGELRPAGLEEMGLTMALEGYVAGLRRNGIADVDIHLDLDEDDSVLQEPIAICLFRVAQEALRNTLKHAAAKNVVVSLHLLADAVTLRVQDDGCGFRVPSRLSQLTQTGHFGLVGMSERVTWAGGQLLIRSQPREGTEVKVKIPLNGGVTGYGRFNSRTASRRSPVGAGRHSSDAEC